MSDNKIPVLQEIIYKVELERLKSLKLPESVKLSSLEKQARFEAKRIMTTSIPKYMKEVVKYTLEQAAENAELKEHPTLPIYEEEVDKQSILSLEEQIIKDLEL